MRLLVVIGLLVGSGACRAPSTKPAPVANRTVPSPAGRTEADLVFEGACDFDPAGGERIDERTSVWIVTCFEGAGDADDENPSASTAYLVRGSSQNRGTRSELGTWITVPEQGESYGIEAVLRDAQGHATHVLIRHGRGGLDQVPDMEILDYLPDRDTFAAKRYSGVDVHVEIGANGTAARIATCRLAPGGTYYQDRTCEQQQGAIVETFTVGR